LINRTTIRTTDPKAWILFGLALLVLMAIPASRVILAEDDGGGKQYEVTVTNLTRGETLTPLLVASHKAGLKFFELGEPASVPLEWLAEGGVTGPLSDWFMGMPSMVREVKTSSGPVMPGGSVTVTVAGGGKFDHISVASMLVPTNDGFFALNGVEGPKGNSTLTYYSPGYDAGTEANDEDCANSIPGPPPCAGTGFDPSRAGSEGYVHIHAGIHGIGSLVAADRDWRNPVAKITIRRFN